MGHDREPVGHTCPEVNEGLEKVAGINKSIDQAGDFLHGLGRLLESLRKSNQALREWGNEEAERVDELESRVDELESELAGMRSQLREAAKREAAKQT